ncbi:MAG: IS3 family transposase [Desulfobulbaceae bacterium]|nr:IS3 family transposase [Desulfobulbaceae bacterium]
MLGTYSLLLGDNSVAESFFGIMKTERNFNSSYATREGALRDIVDYLEVFNNSRRQRTNLGYLSSAEFEKRMVLQNIFSLQR